MTEETFGPTLPIMKVADAEEAIRLANDSPYGLGASVFTKDVARGEAIARRIEAGAVCVNDAQLNYLALELPMGGWKASGLGSRHGAAASASTRASTTSRRTTSRLGRRRSKAKRSSFSASSRGRRTKRAAVSSARRLRCLAMRER
jgi:acyl-CoA reductase-like NAD-dependent aldehyde dehydrogenase